MLTNHSAGSACRAFFARIQQRLIVVLCGVAFAILFPHLGSAQQVSFYDFNIPNANSAQTSTSCSASSAASGVLLCFNSVGSGLSFVLDNSYTTSIDPNASSGSAYALVMTQSSQLQTSSVWYSTPQKVAGGFTAWYAFRITSPSSPSGDGFAFVIQNALGGGLEPLSSCLETGSGLTALGGAGGCMGYGGIDNSVAIEGDTFADSYDPWDFGAGDYDDNHIAMQDCGPGLANSPDHYISNAANPLVPTNCLVSLGGVYAIASNPNSSAGGGEDYIADGAPHQVVIVYNGPSDSPANYIYVYLDPAFNPGTHTPVTGSTPIFSGQFDITQNVNLSNGNAYIGFTAATGGSFEQHELMGFTFTPHSVGSANVCPSGQSTPAPCSETLPVTFSFAADTTIGSVKVVTQGATGLDFTQASGGTCTGTISAGNSCTVNVTFAPIAPGSRMGAVQLLDGGGNVLATQLISGNGQGPEIAFGPGIQTALVGVDGVHAARQVALDGAGDIFIAENLNNQVVKLPAGGGAQTTVGTGLNGPYGVAVDGAGNIFIADTGNNRVVEVPAGGGAQTTVASGLNFPLGVTVDGAGNLFIADTNNNQVLELPPGGGSQTTVATGLNNPNTVVVDSAGDIFIVDSDSELVKIPAGCGIPSCYSTVGAGFNNPRGAAIDAAGDLYVADTFNSQVVEIPAGCTNIGCQTTIGTGFGYPWGLALDGLGNLYVTDTNDGEISEVNRSQPPSLSFATTAVGSKSADSPQSFQALNVGNQTLSAILPGFAVAGVNFLQVSGSGTPPDCYYGFSLAPGAACNVSIWFEPEIAGILSSTATFTDNNLNANPATQILPLSGIAIAPAGVPLTLSGQGNGTVVSTPPGINCTLLAGIGSGTCTGDFPANSIVTLQATPGSGFAFQAWGGVCSTSNATCQFSITGGSAETVTFVPGSLVTVTEVGTGMGTVSSNVGGIACALSGGVNSGTCSTTVPPGTQVAFGAIPSGDTIFAGWGGDCASSGNNQICLVTANSALNVSATFVAQGAVPSGALEPITAGVVYGQGGNFTTGTPNNGGMGANNLSALGGMALDANGNLYVADDNNNRVLFYPHGSTTATRVYGQNGSFTTGAANNGGVSANSLNVPQGLALDGAGNLYIADEFNNRVLFYPAGSTTATRVYGQGGSFTSNTWNNGGVSANSLGEPYGLALDSSGNLYVGDYQNNRVLFYPAGSTTATQVYGQGGNFTTNTVNNGGLSANSLNQPTGVTLDSSGDLYVADIYNNRVLFFPYNSTTATRVYGQGGSFNSNAANFGGVSADSLNNPMYPALDSAGDLYVVDRSNNRVLFYPFGSTTATRVYGQLNSFNSTAANNGGVSANSFSQPWAVALDPSGDLYVSDYSNNRVLEYGPFGNVNVCPNGVNTPAPCSNTVALSYYAAAPTSFGVTQVVTQGVTGLDFALGSGGTCTGTVPAGNTCTVNVNFAPLAPGSRMGAVELFDTGANPLTTAPIYGIGQAPAIAFGPGTQTTVNTGSFPLSNPRGVLVDAAGNLFISDVSKLEVLKVAPNGNVSTVGSGFLFPQGLAEDGAGDLFVADDYLNEVVEIPAGCTSINCQVYLGSNFKSQLGVAADGAGDVFFSDFLDGEVVEIPAGCTSNACQKVVYNPGGGSEPVDLTADAAGDLFIADFGLQEVVELPAGCAGINCQIAIGSGWNQPDDVAVDAAGDVFVADQGLQEIVEVPAGCPSPACQVAVVSGINTVALAVDATGDLVVGDLTHATVFKVNRSQLPSYNFALTNVGATSTDSPELVSIQNVGNQQLTGTLGLNLGTSFVANVSSSCGSGFSLAPGASCFESFNFMPQSTGYFTGTASFSDNTFNLSPLVALQTINLSGNGGLNGQPVGLTVPNVVGLPQATATTMIAGTGLTSGTVSSASSSIVPSGSVIASNPAAGVQVNPGSAVRLLVSTGQAPLPTPNPLTFENNYLVTGDFASAGVFLRGLGTGGMATGAITIPDSTTNPGANQGVPDGADIVDAFLYWETLENTPSPSSTTGTFNNYSITGQQIGSDLNNYTDGTFTGTLRAYRADVNAYFPVGANGIRFASGAFKVSLPDGGGTGFPLTEGASLVVIYRVLSPNLPLKAVVIYDGSAFPATSTTQTVQGFYDAAGPFGSVMTLSAAPGSWIVSNSSALLAPGASQYAVPLSANAAYSAVILSTPVANSDNDGILDAWKAGPAAGDFYAGQPGYYDVKTGSFVPLPGAKHGEKDLFVQLDYMCGAVLPSGACDPNQENLFPAPDASGNDPLAMVTNAYAADGVALHLTVGNAVPEDTCTDNTSTTPAQLCQFPGEPGVIGWKNSLEFSKLWPRNLASCAAGGDCSTRFPYGQKDSYHYVLVGHSLAIPAWNTRYGTLTSIQVASGVTTIVTADRGTLINKCPSRITISGVLGNPKLNGLYNTSSCPDSKTMIMATPGVPNWSYPNSALPEPVIGLTSGTVTSISGYSDLGGADSAVTLGLWETAPNQDMSKRANVIAGTLFHEIGHTIGLSHGGLYYNTPGSYIPTFDVNCKPNYQSVMNYLFQLDGVGPSAAVAYSNQTLETLNDSALASVINLTDPSTNPATFSTSTWYTPNAPSSTASAATMHCDGTPLTGDTGYRVVGSIAPVTPSWSNGQNITFDGVPYTQLPGYNDVANIDLRQVGATGGEFASLSSVLSFGSSSTPLQVAAGGNVTLGGGGTVTLGGGGTVTLGGGGNVTLGGGGTIAPVSGGTVTLNNGANATLSTGGTVTLGGGGTITLGGGGVVTLGSTGTITFANGGTVALGGGGTVTLGGGGTIALGGGGTVTIPSTGGAYTLPVSGGTITLGGGGNVTLGGGGTVTLGGGGTIALGGGGTVTLGGGGNVTLGGGGTIALGGGGTIALGGGGNVTLGGGGTITLGGGGTVTLGGGGNITLGGGGTATLGGGGDVSVGSGGTVTLGGGGTVTLGGGGTMTVANSGSVTLSNSGTITSGGNTQTVSAGTYTVPSGGTVTLGGGGTITLGGGGTVTLGGGGVVALGGGGTVALGGGGTIALGGGGTSTLGSGGATTNELTYETANSIVRPPSLPTETLTSTPTGTDVVVNWTAPAFGVVQTYTISRSSDGGAPIVIGSVSGVNGFPPATTFTDTNPDLTSQTVVYTISTTLLPVPIDPTQRQSAPSTPAILTNNQTIVLGSLPSSVSISSSPLMVTATAETNSGANGLQVNFAAAGSCTVGSQTINRTSGVSSATLTLNSTGSCTITASQPGSNLAQLGNPPYYNPANSVSGTFTIVPQGSSAQSQTILFSQLPNVQYGGTFSLSASSSAGLAVSFAASGPCTTSGTTTGVGLCTITASAPGNSTYSAASAAQSFTIYPAVLVVTAKNLTSVYGQALPALTYSFSPLVNGDPSTAVTGTPALSTTATSASNPGSYPITVSTGSLAAANYSFLYVSGALTIQTATPTISINNLPASAVYGGSFAPAYTYSGNGSPTESAASSTMGVCTVSGGVVSFVGAGTCTLTASATATTDYSAVTGSPQSFTVGKAAPTISINNLPASAVYGGSFAPAYNYSGNGSPTESVASSTTGVCTVSGSVVSLVGVGTCTLTASATATADYSAVTGSPQSFTVGKATPTISINNLPASAAIGSSFTPTYAYSGNGSPTKSVASSTTGVCTVSGGVVSFVGVGTCTLTASATATTDYLAVTGSPQSFAVSKAVQTITFTQPASPVTYGVAPISLSATATSGLTVAFSIDSSSTGTGTISGSTLTVTGAGTLVIDANQSGNTNYQAAAQVQRSIVVNKAAQTIAFTANPPASAPYKSSFTVAATASSGLPIAFTSSGVCSNSGTTYTMSSGTGTCSVIANQAGNSNYAAAASVTKTVTATLVAQTITFTTSPPTTAAYNSTFTVAATGGASGNSVTFTSSGACTNSGATYTMTNSTGTCSVIANQAGNTNYSAAPQVTKTVTATGPLVTVSPSAINFGTVYQGSITTQNITVTNIGTASVTINQPVLSIVQGGNSNEFVAVNLCPTPLAAGKSCTITIAFVAGPYYTQQTAILQIMDNAPGSPQPVTLSAMVIDPLASFSATSLSFGTIKHATSSTLNVTLTNTGATPLIFSGAGISVTGTNATDFQQSNNCGSSLAAGAKCAIAVKFTPPTTGSFSANVTVVDNAKAGSGTQTVSLSGTGN